MTPSSDVWYRQLETDRNFTITYGEDGTGDVYKPANLEALQKLVEKEEINVFVSDGGFRIRKNEKVYILNRIMFWYLNLLLHPEIWQKFYFYYFKSSNKIGYNR